MTIEPFPPQSTAINKVGFFTVSWMRWLNLLVQWVTPLTVAPGAPTTTPASIWERYVDTATGDAYISTGTSSSADWKQIT